MIDLVVEWSCAAAVAWLVTRRALPAQASAAHRLWMLVLAYPLLWLAAGRLVPTIAFVLLIGCQQTAPPASRVFPMGPTVAKLKEEGDELARRREWQAAIAIHAQAGGRRAQGVPGFDDNRMRRHLFWRRRMEGV